MAEQFSEMLCLKEQNTSTDHGTKEKQLGFVTFLTHKPYTSPA